MSENHYLESSSSSANYIKLGTCMNGQLVVGVRALLSDGRSILRQRIQDKDQESMDEAALSYIYENFAPDWDVVSSSRCRRYYARMHNPTYHDNKSKVRDMCALAAEKYQEFTAGCDEDSILPLDKFLELVAEDCGVTIAESVQAFMEEGSEAEYAAYSEASAPMPSSDSLDPGDKPEVSALEEAQPQEEDSNCPPGVDPALYKAFNPGK